MAASNTIPTEKANPAIEIIFKVRPVIYMTIRVIIIEIGMATATINVALNLRKNHHKTLIAKRIPNIKLFFTKAIERPM